MEPMKPMAPMKPMEPIKPAVRWWPDGLGEPSSSGGQNDVRYAFFPGKHRLAIQQGGKVTVYDSEDHRISGVFQQQGSGSSLAFTSQKGNMSLGELKKM